MPFRNQNGRKWSMGRLLPAVRSPLLRKGQPLYNGMLMIDTNPAPLL